MTNQQFTEKSREALASAQQLTIEYQNQEVTQEHLAYALLSDAQGLIPQLLTKMGKQPQEIASRLETMIARQPGAQIRQLEAPLYYWRMNPASVVFERPEIASYCADANAYMGDFCKATGADWHLVSYVPRFHEVMYLDTPPEWYGWAQSHALRDYRPAGSAAGPCEHRRGSDRWNPSTSPQARPPRSSRSCHPRDSISGCTRA